MKTVGMTKLMVGTVVMVLVAVLAFGAIACGPAKPEAPSGASTSSGTPAAGRSAEWQKWNTEHEAWVQTTYAAAKKEGKLTVITGVQTFVDPATEAFEKKYPGINVEFLIMLTSDRHARIRAERASKKFTLDVVLDASSSYRSVLAPEGHLTRFLPLSVSEPGVKLFLDPLMDKDMFQGGFGLMYSADTSGWMINTNLVPPERMPKTYKDLLDPYWKGKLVFLDPRIPGHANRQFWAMEKLYGPGYWKQMKSQIAKFETQMIAGRSVAGGEYPFFGPVGGEFVVDLLKEKLPIKFVRPEDGVPIQLGGIAVIADGPNPNAAKLFVDFWFSKEGQAVVAAATKAPIREGVDVPYPELIGLTGVKLMQASQEEEAVDFVRLRNEAKTLWP